MGKKIITLIILICSIVSCQHIDYVAIDTKSDSCKVLNLDPVFESKTFSLYDLIDTIKIIALETNSESILSDVNLLKMSEKYIFVQDRYQNGSVAIFDINGKFVRRLRQGNGPGEINGVCSFDFDEHYLYTLQYEKINKYSLSGDFIDSYSIIEKYNILFDCIQIVDDGFLFAISPCDSKSGKYEVLHTDKEFNAQRQFVFNHSFVGYNPRKEFKSQKSGVIFFPSMCNTIYGFDGNSFRPLYTLIYPKYGNTFETNPDCMSPGLEFYERHCVREKFFADGRVFQTQDYMYLTFCDGSLIISVYLDKKNGRFRSGYFPSTDDLPVWPISFYDYVRCTFDDYFVNMLPPNVYLAVEGSHLNEDVSMLQHISDEDKQKILNAKDDDNPLIIMYKLKGIE